MVRSATLEDTQGYTCSVDDVINGLKCDLTNGDRRAIKFLLPKTKVAVNNRELCKVGMA